jgi:hypothetical protein
MMREPRNSSVPDPAALDALRWPVRAALEKLGAVGRAEPFSYTVESAHRMPAIRYTLSIRLLGPGGTRGGLGVRRSHYERAAWPASDPDSSRVMRWRLTGETRLSARARCPQQTSGRSPARVA